MRTFAALLVALAIAKPAYAATTTSAPTPVTTTPMPMASMMPMAGMMKMMMEHHLGEITVQSTGEVHYVPDVAHITLGVNGEADTAAAAASDISTRADAVISTLKSLGIPAADIRTNGFNLYHRESTQTVKAAYVASEVINIKSAVDKVGPAIDAAIRAGANQSYGLQFDASARDTLYRQAVQNAVQQAHDLAQAAASAGGVKLGALRSITVPSVATPGIMPLMRTAMPMAQAAAPPPIEPGTGAISASVSVTYSIAR